MVHGFRNNLNIACRLMQEDVSFSLGEKSQPDVLGTFRVYWPKQMNWISARLSGKWQEAKDVAVSLLCDQE